MAQLAIKGHTTRGSEVIEILEMLGGKNIYNLTGTKEIWYILSGSTIEHSVYLFEEKGFTLEEFLEKYPYKVGDKVLCVRINDFIGRITNLRWDDNEEQIIYTVEWDDATKSTLTYFVRYLQPYKEETMEDKPNLLQQLKEYFGNTPREVVEKEWYEYDKYNKISPKVNEYLEYVNNIRQSKYPKTYKRTFFIYYRVYQIHSGYGKYIYNTCNISLNSNEKANRETFNKILNGICESDKEVLSWSLIEE